MKKILVAEDEAFLANAFRIKLTKAGFQVVIAADGAEASTKVRDEMPDLMLLDLMMPKKDGFTVLAEIKQDEQLKNIPVIITSNLGQKEDVEKAIKLGASEFIIKSELSLDDLIKKIHRYIGE